MPNPYKTAVLLTGAGARISQEVAMLDLLMANHGLVLNQDNTMLTGFSSGSLNILAINGCFRADNPASWDDYYKGTILQNLKTSDVFKPKLPPFDTTPLRSELNGVLNTFGYNSYGDLPFNSNVLTFSRHDLQTEWANTKTKGQDNLVASDVFMASTAIPAIFPAQTIATVDGGERDFPTGKFNDGGTMGQFKRFSEHLGNYVLQNGAFEEMFIISPMRANHSEDVENELNASAEEHGLNIDLGEIHINTTAMRAFVKFVKKLQKWNQQHGNMAGNIYVSIPALEKNFPMLNFNDQMKKYQAVMDWGNANPDKVAIPLDEYVAGVD